MNLSLVIGWTLCIFVIALEAVILWLILRGDIDLSRLISEPNGDASMSRFQLLIFTFVVALCLFLVVVGTKDGTPKFPDIPGTVLALLGISASSYTVSKAIQFTSAEGVQERPAEIHVTPASRSLGLNQSSTFAATVIRSEDEAIKWSVVPPVGEIDQSGKYKAPDTLAQDHVYVQVRASLLSNPDVFGVASLTVTKGTPQNG